MATKKRGGLGRGIGALIPQAPSSGERPVDVFFPANGTVAQTDAEGAATSTSGSDESAEVELREVPGAQLTRLDISDIVPNRLQPRTEFDEEALEELTHSVREFGVFQPIVVRGFSK